MTDFLRRLKALTKKEFWQMSRDSSSFLIGILLPVVLILLMGYGISMDVKNVPVAVVLEDTSPTAQDAVSFMDGSEYFSPAYVTSMAEAKEMLWERQVDGIVVIPQTFTSDLYRHEAKVQVILYGTDSASATTVQGYVEAGMGQWASSWAADHSSGTGTGNGSVNIESRMWFNDANTSTWYFVPGLLMLIMTIVGVFLTALVMAREWERGTLESLFITPVQILEILLAKVCPYFCIALLGLTLCLLASRYLYGVPMHGSLWLIIAASMLYLIVSLSIGLVISSVTKSQFLSCQLSLVVSFMPSVMLTGFIFDLRSTPAIVGWIGQFLPPTYYLQLMKSLFLAGNNWPLIEENFALLALYAVVFIGLAFKVTKKRLD